MITAIVMIATESDKIPEVAEAIADIDGVSEVYSVAGDVDLIAIVRVREFEAIADVIAGQLSKIEGVIHTDDFKVSAKLLGMIGHGDVRFLDDKVDFDIRIDANGPGVLLTPMYKLFEYKGEGSISKPNWHPKRF